MLDYRKFGVLIYCSTILVAAIAVGFTLFIGAIPSNINLFNRNSNVRNWLFITAAFSLAYIILSAFTTFCILVSKSTKKLNSSSKYANTKVSGVSVDTDSTKSDLQQRNKYTDITSPLSQSSNITNKLLLGSIVSGRQGDNSVSCSKLQSTKKDKDIVQVNIGHFDDQYNQEVSLSSSIYGCIPSSQLRLNHKTDDLTEIDEKNGNKSKIIDEGSEQRCPQMYVPEHIYLDVWF